MILEFGLIILGIVNLVFEAVNLDSKQSYKLGIGFCIFFMANQIVATIISFA